MWVAKIKLNGEKGSIGSRTKKFGVSVSGYPVSSYKTKKGIYVYLVGFILGREDDKKRFIRDIKRGEKTQHFEIKGDLIIAQILEPPRLEQMYSHKLINLKPIIIDEKGFNYWTLGSWDKKELIKFVRVVEREYKGELISINQEKIEDFSIIHIQPKLTNKQKQAMDMAIKYGYYDYPRKIDVQKLAKLSKLSFSTFHAHLRKAEQKLLPYFFNRY
ncbi:MAG: helix-turn-helix domain-containing protein [Candidatus Heimdallarchaeaceae archaeon]